MATKAELVQMLHDEFRQWESLLAGLSQEQITERPQPGARSIKDDIAHLWAWQRRSIARLDAARNQRDPEYPEWPVAGDPDADDHSPDAVNEWIFETNRDRPWPEVLSAWRNGFLRFITQAEATPEKDLLEKDKYAWLPGYSLADVLIGSYEHHHIDHLQPLLERLGRTTPAPSTSP
jgi:hypothetical protein